MLDSNLTHDSKLTRLRANSRSFLRLFLDTLLDFVSFYFIPTFDHTFFFAVAVKEGSPSDDELEFLSRRIGRWRPLGRQLKFDNEMLLGFHKDNQERCEKVFAMLIAWKKRDGSAATYQVLHQALCHEYVGRRALAEKICCSCKP